MKARCNLPRVALVAAAVLGLGCAQLSQLVAAMHPEPPLQAMGPGTVFPSIEAAAVDALTYTYLQAKVSRDTDRMRGGTIRAAGDGFSYGDVVVASPLSPNRLNYVLVRDDVARFQMYPLTGPHDAIRANERLSQPDRRSVEFVDPLQRPLYVLHPSMVIRAYHARSGLPVEVADLRHPTQQTLIAGR